MAVTNLSALLRHMRQLTVGKNRDDRELLKAFVDRQDEDCFAALVRRYGPLVLRVCRSVLHHEQDAEDVFQATFLVLALKAASIHNADTLASFLHRTAYRLALHARRDAARRRAREARAPTPSPTEASNINWQEVQTLLEEEIERLPDKYRLPFLLCHVQGLSRAEAAQKLALKEGTVWSRLNAARTRLQKRLAQRGIALPAVLGAVALSGSATATVPMELLDATARCARFLAAEGVHSSLLSAHLAVLVRAGLRGMALVKGKLLVGLLLVLGGVIGSVGAFGISSTPAPSVPLHQDERLVPPGAADSPAAVRDTRRKQQGREKSPSPYDKWLAYAQKLRADPRLILYYTFQEQQPENHILHNRALVQKGTLDGTISGCQWSEGRWPGKKALDFKHRGDCVRLQIPGEYQSLTILAWVRVEAFERRYGALMLTDGWDQGAPHWQIHEGKLLFGFRDSRGKGHWFYSPPCLGPERIGEWLQLATVYNHRSRTVTHYVDGQPVKGTHYMSGERVKREDFDFEASLQIGNTEIGNWGRVIPGTGPEDIDRSFKGRIDEFALFREALSAEEIARVHEIGKACP